MKFEYPHLLWLLLVLPPTLAAFFWWAWRQHQRLMAQFVEARLLAALTTGVSLTRRKIRWACLVTAAALLLVALARPQWGFVWEETRQRGLDIVVAIDTSKSMLAEDIAPNRLTRAKLAALDLMQQAKSDRLGLVAFAGGAFLQCPLTIDDAAFRQCLDTLDVNIIPQGGTAVAEAIQTATTAFKRDNDNYKVLVLFTDGEDNDEGAVEAATKAEKAGLKIFTVGIGTAEGELLRLTDDKGRTDYVRDEQGNVVKSHLNEGLLQQIAGAGGGFYLPLRGAKTIDTLYEKGLAPLPKSESKERLVKRYHERFYWPLALAILLLLIETLFPERKRESRSGRVPATSGRPVLTETAALFVLLMLSAPAFGSPATALREYRAGQYEDALKEYKQLLDKKGDDPRLRFNAGASAYRDGQFNEAAKHFGDVLAAPDLQLQQDAYYNLGNTFFQIGQNTVDPSKKTEAWEKALKDYESTMKLNPQDPDAKFNHEFVKRKLEELKQQQQQQQQQNQDNKDQQKDQDKQGEQQQNQNQQNQQNQQDQQKDQSQQQQKEQKQQEQQQQQQQQAQQKQKQEQKQDSQPSQAGKDQDKKDPQSAQSRQQEDQPSKEGEQAEAAPAYAGQMTPQQARQLLDAQKAEEAMIPIKPEGKPIPANRSFKDW